MWVRDDGTLSAPRVGVVGRLLSATAGQRYRVPQASPRRAGRTGVGGPAPEGKRRAACLIGVRRLRVLRVACPLDRCRLRGRRLTARPSHACVAFSLPTSVKGCYGRLKSGRSIRFETAAHIFADTRVQAPVDELTFGLVHSMGVAGHRRFRSCVRRRGSRRRGMLLPVPQLTSYKRPFVDFRNSLGDFGAGFGTL